MENKVESPDYQMDISEAGTITADNISTSSASPTISNQADNEISCGEKSNGIDTIVETVTKNMNSLDLTASNLKSLDKESVENRNTLTLDTTHQHHHPQKLTPVRHHPLMMMDDDIETEDSFNNTRLSNFPDVVPAKHQPMRSPAAATKTQAASDLVNSVNNNNDTKSRKPIYREPSPVSSMQTRIIRTPVEPVDCLVS